MIKNRESSESLTEEIAFFMRRLYERGLTTTSGGNISARYSSGKILITPSMLDKGRMEADQIGFIDMEGNSLSAQFKPTIESRLHLAVYRSRPDVQAVVHAHPVAASAISASSSEISLKYISEHYAILGNIAYTEYMAPGSPELAESVAAAAEKSDCIVWRNHGVMCVGETLLQAFDRMEVLENAARTTLINRSILKGEAVELSPDSLAELDVLMGRTPQT